MRVIVPVATSTDQMSIWPPSVSPFFTASFVEKKTVDPSADAPSKSWSWVGAVAMSGAMGPFGDVRTQSRRRLPDADTAGLGEVIRLPPAAGAPPRGGLGPPPGA